MDSNPCKHILNMHASIACKGWDQMQKNATCDSRKVTEKAVLTILTGDWKKEKECLVVCFQCFLWDYV